MNQKQAMLQRFQRLQHSTEERASPAMPEKQGQAAQAVKRAYQRKQILHENMDSAQNVRKRLLFDETMPKAPRGAAPGAVLHNVNQQITRELRHQVTEQNEDENVGVTAAVQVEQMGERLPRKGEQLHQYRQVRTSKAHRMDSTLQRNSNPFSRWRQTRNSPVSWRKHRNISVTPMSGAGPARKRPLIALVLSAGYTRNPVCTILGGWVQQACTAFAKRLLRNRYSPVIWCSLRAPWAMQQTALRMLVFTLVGITCCIAAVLSDMPT